MRNIQKKFRGMTLVWGLLLACLAGCAPPIEQVTPTGWTAPTLAAEKVANALFHSTEAVHSRVYSQGEWSLLVFYRLKGTRSEGQHGILLRNGVEVPPAAPGSLLQTDLGEMKYYTHPEQMRYAWDVTGWNFSNAALILRWGEK